MNNDFECVPCGTENALREALNLLGIKVEGSPVEAWRNEKKADQEFIASLYKSDGNANPPEHDDSCWHKWANQYPSGMVCIYCNKTIMTDIQIADLEGRN